MILPGLVLAGLGCVFTPGPGFDCVCNGTPMPPAYCGCYLWAGECACPDGQNYPLGYCSDDVCMLDRATNECWCDSELAPAEWCGPQPTPAGKHDGSVGGRVRPMIATRTIPTWAATAALASTLTAPACGPFLPGFTTTGDESTSESGSTSGGSTDPSVTSGAETGQSTGSTSVGDDGSSSSGSTTEAGMVSSSSGDPSSTGEGASTGADSTGAELCPDPYMNAIEERCWCDGVGAIDPALCGCYLDDFGDETRCVCDDGSIWNDVTCGWECIDAGTGCLCGNFPAPDDWCTSYCELSLGGACLCDGVLSQPEDCGCFFDPLLLCSCNGEQWPVQACEGDYACVDPVTAECYCEITMLDECMCGDIVVPPLYCKS